MVLKSHGKDDMFKCLNGLLIKHEQVDDEYCDCGDDEPNTSACAGFSKATNFICTGEPLRLSSSRVNDGICDCCDGSDETRAQVKCPNECGAKLLQYHQNLAKFQESLASGFALFKRDVLPAAQKRAKELEQQIVKDEADKQRLHTEIESKETSLEELKPICEQILAQQLLASHHNVLGRLGFYDAEAAIQALLQKFPDLTKQGNTIEQIFRNILGSLKHRIHEIAEHLDLNIESEEWMQVRDFISQNLNEQCEDLKAHEQELLESKRTFDRLERNLRQQRSSLFRDHWGYNDALVYLKDKCISKAVDNQNYKLCFFDKCNQGNLLVGMFDSWEELSTDSFSMDVLQQQIAKNSEVIPPPVGVMKYEKGLRCHQGTIRSASVFLSCHSDDVIFTIEEPSICVYQIYVGTPAVCFPAWAGALNISDSMISNARLPAVSLQIQSSIRNGITSIIENEQIAMLRKQPALLGVLSFVVVLLIGLVVLVCYSAMHDEPPPRPPRKQPLLEAEEDSGEDPEKYGNSPRNDSLPEMQTESSSVLT